MVHENENNSASLLIAKKTDLRACTSKPHLYVIAHVKFHIIKPCLTLIFL